jgi:integrase
MTFLPPTAALGQIEAALQMDGGIRVLHHTRGQILGKLALNAENEDVGRKWMLQSEQEFRVCLSMVPTDDYAYQGLASLFLDWAIELRNRALIAFTLLTGARDSAITSMKLKHIDLIADCVNQDAREVQTKFSKTFITYFFPVGDEIRTIVADWVSYLRKDNLWGNDDPLFPATRITLGVTRQFEVCGLERDHWSSASPIRRIFREAFIRAGLPYFNPHSFRNTVVQLGEEKCKTPEQFKAWSQNLGHEKVLTTFVNYGEVACQRQGEIIRDLAKPQQAMQPNADEIVEAVFKKLRDSGVDKKVK